MIVITVSVHAVYSMVSRKASGRSKVTDLKKKKNFNYFFPKEIDDFVDIVNEFSKRKMTKEEIIYEIN